MADIDDETKIENVIEESPEVPASPVIRVQEEAGVAAASDDVQEVEAASSHEVQEVEAASDVIHEEVNETKKQPKRGRPKTKS